MLVSTITIVTLFAKQFKICPSFRFATTANRIIINIFICNCRWINRRLNRNINKNKKGEIYLQKSTTSRTSNDNLPTHFQTICTRLLVLAMVLHETQFQCCCYSFHHTLPSFRIINDSNTKKNDRIKLYGRKLGTGQSSSSSSSSTSSQSSYSSRESDTARSIAQERKNTNPPIPSMPSQLFQQLALSQLELLASAIPADPNDHYDPNDDESHSRSTSTTNNTNNNKHKSKIKSMALYLPQENKNTGQLEFLPAVLFPNPNNERVFIANGVNSGIAPTLPKHLTTLPGFANAKSLLPAYPMVSSDDEDAGVGVVEEVLCGLRDGGTALSVPLFIGSQTVGVLLVSPAMKKKSAKKTVSSVLNNNGSNNTNTNTIELSKKKSSFWTNDDRKTVARAAKSLSLALSLDYERTELRIQNDVMYESLSDSLHQFKNPLQALRTFGKLLQQRIADTTTTTETTGDSTTSSRSTKNNVPQILELTEHLMIQSDRLVERLKPVDEIVELLGEQQKQRNIQQQRLLSPQLSPVSKSGRKTLALVPWRAPLRIGSAEYDDDDDDNQRPRRTTALDQQQQQQMLHDALRPTTVIPKQQSQNHKKPRNRMDHIQNVTAEVVVMDNNNDEEIKSKTTKDGSTTATATTSSRLKRIKTKMNRTGKRTILEDNRSSNNKEASWQSISPPPTTIGTTATGDIITNLEFQMSFVQDVLEPILIGFRAIADENNITFEIVDNDDLPGIMICPQALQEVFTNVLDNAFKYVTIGKLQQQQQQSFDNKTNDDDSTNNNDNHQDLPPTTNPNPHVRVRFVSNTNHHPSKEAASDAVGVTIIIEDNGPGISTFEMKPTNGDQSLLFQRGYRNKQYKHCVHGNGIGLHIAHTLMERMGGIIRFMDPKLRMTTTTTKAESGTTWRNRNSDRQVPYLDGTIVELVLFRQIGS